MNGSESKKISPVNFGFMLLFAICFDILTIIPFINIIVNFIALICFTIWFYFSGVSFSKNKAIVGRSAVTFLIELIPFISIIPTWTANIIINYISINRNARKDSKSAQNKLDKRNEFEKLRDKRTHTAEEIHKLNRAREAMRGAIRPGEERDPVIAAGYEEFKKKKKKEESQTGYGPLQTAQDLDEERRTDPRQRAITAEESLRMKVNRTPEEQLQLRRAQEIQKTGKIRQGEVEGNPVFRAAYEDRKEDA